MNAGCPKCGAERLKAAPMPFIEAPFRWLSRGRRRYRCSACGWSGRRGRLKRRSDHALPSLGERRLPKRRAVVFFVAVVLVVAVSFGLFVRQCTQMSRSPLTTVAQ